MIGPENKVLRNGLITAWAIGPKKGYYIEY